MQRNNYNNHKPKRLFAYEYNQRWAVRLPRRDIRTFVSRFHCATDPAEVERETRKIIEKSQIPTRLVPQCIRYALLVFNEHVALYRRVSGTW